MTPWDDDRPQLTCRRSTAEERREKFPPRPALLAALVAGVGEEPGDE